MIPEKYKSIYNITWPIGQRFPEPYERITRDEFFMAVHKSAWVVEYFYEQLYIKEQGTLPKGLHPSYNFYATHGGIYTFLSTWGTKERIETEFPDADIILHKDGVYADAIVFYRIGCSHPNIIHTSPRMFDQKYDCPDCGWGYMVDSSG